MAAAGGGAGIDRTHLVTEALGHSDLGITLNTYSHVLTELKRETVARMDAILSTKWRLFTPGQGLR